MDKKKSVGGQAVIEGVMMKSKTRIAVAVRKPNGKISVKVQNHRPWAKLCPIFALPVIRGFVELVEMLIFGVKALMHSSNEAAEADEKLGAGSIALTFAAATVFTIAAFIALPLFAARLLTSGTGFWFDFTDGIARIAVFLAYVLAISQMKDIRRVFQYHGAEHCTINCYESGKKLTPENAIKFSTFHPRCGTSFLVIVIAISIVVFTFITDPRWIVKFFSRLLLIPLIAGVGYELLKLSAKFSSTKIVKALIFPGLCIQKITAKKPDKMQVEVAIAALKEAVQDE